MESDGSVIRINSSPLSTLSVRPSFGAYLAQLVNRRYFILADARSRAFSDVRDYRLGNMWIIVKPLLEAVLYGFIFGVILKTSQGIDNFVGYLVLGIAFFGFLQRYLMAGTTLVSSQRNMIQSFMFPRASVVFSESLRFLLNSMPSAAVAVLIGLIFQVGEPLNWTLVLVIPLFLLLHTFGTGLLFIVGRICAFVPDAKVFVELAGRGWFFISGVFFSVERFATTPELQFIMMNNPAYQFLTAVRGAVLYGEAPSATTWGTLLAWAASSFMVGLIFFWLAEERYVSVR